MLKELPRRNLAPYKRWIAIVVLLQLVGTIASLYLPSLNADLIDNGVVPVAAAAGPGPGMPTPVSD